jgi:hypothetical protein
MVGGFLTGIFATSRISSLDGESIFSGAIDGNGIQVAKQLGEIAAISAYSFSVSICLLMILKYIPGLHLRVTDEVEELGYDLDQFHDETIGEVSAVYFCLYAKTCSAQLCQSMEKSIRLLLDGSLGKLAQIEALCLILPICVPQLKCNHARYAWYPLCSA